MDNEIDYKIKEFITKDKNISKKANDIFDNFINEIKNDDVNEKQKTVYVETRQPVFFKFKKLLAVAASLAIVFVGADIYAKTHGYENVFFMIQDWTTPKEEVVEEIFEDDDIIISYKYFKVTENVEMQINELQIQNNTANLIMKVRELNENTDVPFLYKVYDDENKLMYEGNSQKEIGQTKYSEILKLSNYRKDLIKFRLEIYNNNNILIKSAVVNLVDKTIEARTENEVVQKISKIELKEFLEEETKKCYSEKELKDKEVIILQIYDILYSQGKYTVKYLYMMPTDEEFENNTVEESKIYSKTIEFTSTGNKFTTIKIEEDVDS